MGTARPPMRHASYIALIAVEPEFKKVPPQILHSEVRRSLRRGPTVSKKESLRKGPLGPQSSKKEPEEAHSNWHKSRRCETC